MTIINAPRDAAARVWSVADMAQLEALVAGTDIVILSDEVYEHMVFDGIRHESIARYPRLAQRSFVVSTFGRASHHRLENRLLPRRTGN